MDYKPTAAGIQDGKYKIADIVKVYLDRINELIKRAPPEFYN